MSNQIFIERYGKYTFLYFALCLGIGYIIISKLIPQGNIIPVGYIIAGLSLLICYKNENVENE
jgi:hypothetical protein